MDLSIYDIIQRPIITEKANNLREKQSKLVFSVHMQANKPLVADAIEKLFNVKVDSVRIMVIKGKLKRSRPTGKLVHRKAIKKAVVTLSEGHALDLFSLGDATVAASKVQSSGQQE
jgi:large subunit ribosomal protein L23